MTGPLHDATQVMLGNYNGQANASLMPLLWQSLANLTAVRAAGVKVVTNGSFNDACNTNQNTTIPAVVAAVKSSNAAAVVLVLGGDCNEGEGRDRNFLHLPGAQSELFTAVEATGVKLVVVLINGGPISIDDIKPTDASVISAGYAINIAFWPLLP